MMEFLITLPDEIGIELDILAKEANLFLHGANMTDPDAVPDREALIRHIIMSELKPKMVAARLETAKSAARAEVNAQITKIKVTQQKNR